MTALHCGVIRRSVGCEYPLLLACCPRLAPRQARAFLWDVRLARRQARPFSCAVIVPLGGTTLGTLGRCLAASCAVWVTALALACGGGPPARAAGPEPKLPRGSQLEREFGTGTIRFLKGQDLSQDLDADPTFKASRLGGDVEGVARAFLRHFSSLWKLDDPDKELVKQRIQVDRTGASHVRFEQAWQGLRIPGAELIVHLDRDRRVVLVTGGYVPTPRGLETTPKLDAAEARAAAAKETGTAPCDACTTELVVFAERGSDARLAWRIAPPKGQIKGEEITVDAKGGSLLRRLPAAQAGRMKLGGER